MKQAIKFWTALSLLVLVSAVIAGMVITAIINAVVWLVGG